MGVPVGSTLEFRQVAAAALPGVGNTLLYVKSDGKIYTKNNAGVEVSVEPAIVAGTAAQFWRGDKTWQSLLLTDLPDAWVKRSVRCATTANLAALSGLLTIDGITVAANDRVLVKDQTTSSANGIYLASSGAWTRATDADTAAKMSGAMVAIDSGTVNGGARYHTIFRITDTLGTGAMPWAEDYSDANPPGTLQQTTVTAASVPSPPAGQSTQYTVDGKSLSLKASDGTVTTIGPGGLVAMTAQVSVSAVATVTPVISYTVPANAFAVGRTYQVTASGTVDNAAASPTFNWALRLGGTTIATVQVASVTAAGTNKAWQATALLTCRTIGASGKIVGSLQVTNEIGMTFSAAVNIDSPVVNAGVFNTTGALALDLAMNMGTAAAGNVMRAEVGVIKLAVA